MLPGISGSLVSSDFLSRLPDAFARFATARHPRAGGDGLTRWWRGVASRCGPASSVRSLVDTALVPLAAVLGFDVTRIDAGTDQGAVTLTAGNSILPVLVSTWNVPADQAWRGAARLGLLHASRWCVVYSGARLRLLEVARIHSRRYLDFELPLVLESEPAADVLWMLLCPDAVRPGPSGEAARLDEIVRSSENEGVRVCASLRGGVLRGIERILGALASDAARRRQRAEVTDLHEEALTAVYRLLFLLFAEARALVPSWHPVYRRSYSMEALRALAERGGAAPGLWEALQAVGRLAHAGCHAGDLEVPAFNGRLFSPVRAPRLDAWRLDDESIRQALLDVSTVREPRGQGRHRISFADLGVEELGAVYEGLLEYEPRVTTQTAESRGRRAHPPRIVARLEPTGAAHRKATGTFYTPRSLTGFLVRQALEPLVRNASCDRLLGLRVCDPAMGSGAFLVAACHYLADAYEAALVAAGSCAASDIGERERAGFRRLVAQRCLYGVDANPMAVQLARLSLWLTTLAADQPLTFLDHHLVAGDSLIGAGPLDLLLGAEPRGRTPGGDRQLPLFDPSEFSVVVSAMVPVRRHLERAIDADATIVRGKEAALSALAAREDLRRWRAACDVWCWNWCADRPVPAGTLRGLLDGVLHGDGSPGALDGYLASAREGAAARGFHHWPLQFPEAFFDEDGASRPDAGFDAVIGNPPWDVLRADAHQRRRSDSDALSRFARKSRLYSPASCGHANQYLLFVDRALSLVRRGGRIGLVVPGGLALDASAAAHRRRLLHECAVDVLVGFDNRSGVFPIHRSTRFLLVTATRGERTERIRCRFGLQDPAELDGLPDHPEPDRAGAFPITVTPGLLERLSGPDLSIPYLRTSDDLRIAERLTTSHPALDAPNGWDVRFARELNATDHRRHFTRARRGLPVLEGKHVMPFAVHPERATWWIEPARAARLLGDGRFRRPRLAFRDVAGASNRQTVIAAILPADTVTTHTLFCLRTRLSDSDQRVLCALLNSYVANFLVRLRVGTHVTLAVMRTIPVPRPEAGSPLHRELDRGVRALEKERQDGGGRALAELQALAAAAYGVSLTEYAHVLSTFPLTTEAERGLAMDAFTRRSRARDR